MKNWEKEFEKEKDRGYFYEPCFNGEGYDTEVDFYEIENFIRKTVEKELNQQKTDIKRKILRKLNSLPNKEDTFIQELRKYIIKIAKTK